MTLLRRVALAIVLTSCLVAVIAPALHYNQITRAETDQQYFDAARSTDFAYFSAIIKLLSRPVATMSQDEIDGLQGEYSNVVHMGRIAYLTSDGAQSAPETDRGFQSVDADFRHVNELLYLLINGDQTLSYFYDLKNFNWSCWISGWKPDGVLGTPNRMPIVTCSPEWMRQKSKLPHKFSALEKTWMLRSAIYYYAKAERDARAADPSLAISSDYIR